MSQQAVENLTKMMEDKLQNNGEISVLDWTIREKEDNFNSDNFFN